jgi:zeaxanthin glucosyltransferase
MKALFILTPAIGHYAATFPVINSLNNLGYTTYVTVNNEYEGYINSLGYNTCTLNASPFGLDYDLIGNFSTNQQKEVLNKRMEYEIYDLRKQELIQIFNHVKPNLVFIDTQNATDFIPLYTHLKNQKSKVFFLQTTMSTSVSWESPNYNSFCPPNKIFKIVFENVLNRLYIYTNRIFDWIRFLGFDDKSTITKKFSEENISFYYSPIWIHPIGCTFNNITTLIASPQELEFGKKNKTVVYLGSSVSKKGNYLKKITNLNSNKELLYISFGTLNLHKTKVIESFLERLNRVLISFPNLNIITSGGMNLELINRNKDRWNRIDILPYLDQMEILNKCDYFISHGGLNSIKEAIHFKVPMLIYPLEGDQFGNAQKVKYYDLGLCGEIELESVKSIKSKLATLINNKEKYILKLDEFNRRISYYNTTEILLKSINETAELQ